MKKNDVFTFTAPNGVEVVGVVVDVLATWYEHGGLKEIVYLCYAQNRLFTWKEEFFGSTRNKSLYGRVAAENVTLPDYDRILEDYYHELDMADDYASREY